MMMATWAAAAMAAAVSGPGNPFLEPTVAMPLNNLPLKHSESQTPGGPVKFPYPTPPFPFHPVPSALPTYSSKLPPRGSSVPSDLRHGFPYSNLLGINDAAHIKYPESTVCSSRGGPLNKNAHLGPIDFTRLSHPWNWTFGFPSTFSSPSQSTLQSHLQPTSLSLSRPPLVPPAPTSSAVMRPAPNKGLNELAVPSSDLRNGRSRLDGTMPVNGSGSGQSNTTAATKPSELPTKLRSGSAGSQANDALSPSSTASCLVCAWEEKRREGVITESDPRFVGLDIIPHSCRPSLCNELGNNNSTTGVGGETVNANINRPKLRSDVNHGSWFMGSDIGNDVNPSGSHPGPTRVPSTSSFPACDPAILPELMKSIAPLYQSFRPPFGPANLDPCMMLYCTELLRQHCRGAFGVNNPPGVDRQSGHGVSPRFSRPSSRVDSVGSTGRTAGHAVVETTGPNPATSTATSPNVKCSPEQQQKSPIAQNVSSSLMGP